MALLASQSAWSFSFLPNASEHIQRELNGIEAQLKELPTIPPPSTPQTLGYRSRKLDSQETQVAIEVFFIEPAPVDLIVLMPAAYSDWASMLMDFGFPERFFIERIFPDGTTDIVADYRNTDYIIPGIEPQLFACPDAKPISGIRITSTRCSGRHPAGRVEYTVGFSELYAFSGKRNVALNAEVKTSNTLNSPRIWSENYLVDGFTLFPPIDLTPDNSVGDYRASAKHVVLTYDLGTTNTVDEFRIWPTSSTRPYLPPLIYGSDFPSEIMLEKLDSLEKSNPVVLFKSAPGSTPIPGLQPFMHRVTPTMGRYFRLTLDAPFSDPRHGASDRIALGEIEFLNDGEVLNREITPQIALEKLTGRLQGAPNRLSDGRTSEGEIIPLREWLQQFSQQRQLLRQQSALQLKLDQVRQSEKQRTTLIFSIGFALIIILLLMVLIVRLLASRRWAKMREQIATDLHDEIGANLSSIVHSGEIARELLKTPENPMLQEVLSDVVNTARLTANETRQFVRLLEDRETGVEATGHIRKTAQQILGNIEYTCTFDEHRIFNLLNPARKWDLLFFIKEALNNIVKHAEASHVEIATRRHGKKLQLIISDNGRGIPQHRFPLHHLESRAKRLKAEMNVITAPGQGTRIEINLKNRRMR